MQIEGVDAQHDEESQGAGIEREVVAEGRLAEQQNGAHEGGAHQGGRQTREEGVAPEGDGDDEIADPSPTEGKHVLEGKNWSIRTMMPTWKPERANTWLTPAWA